MSNETQKRATYNDTQRHQKKLRERLDELGENNLPMTKEKREEFFELSGDSLLGKDFNYECTLRLPGITVLQIKNLGEFIRELAYQNTIVDKEFLEKYGKSIDKKIQAKDIWHEVKFNIFGIFPGALEDALHISKEREIVRAGKGATIDDIRR
jgi:hypothetical protein